MSSVHLFLWSGVACEFPGTPARLNALRLIAGSSGDAKVVAAVESIQQLEQRCEWQARQIDFLERARASLAAELDREAAAKLALARELTAAHVQIISVQPRLAAICGALALAARSRDTFKPQICVELWSSCVNRRPLAHVTSRPSHPGSSSTQEAALERSEARAREATDGAELRERSLALDVVTARAERDAYAAEAAVLTAQCAAAQRAANENVAEGGRRLGAVSAGKVAADVAAARRPVSTALSSYSFSANQTAMIAAFIPYAARSDPSRERQGRPRCPFARRSRSTMRHADLGRGGARHQR